MVEARSDKTVAMTECRLSWTVYVLGLDSNVAIAYK